VLEVSGADWGISRDREPLREPADGVLGEPPEMQGWEGMLRAGPFAYANAQEGPLRTVKPDAGSQCSDLFMRRRTDRELDSLPLTCRTTC
jgi:hypothetical protein